jgi:dUTPase
MATPPEQMNITNPTSTITVWPEQSIVTGSIDGLQQKTIVSQQTLDTVPEVLYQLTKTARFHPVLRNDSNGFDLPLQNDIQLEPSKIVKVNLGVCVQFPPNFCGLLVNKSSAVTLFNTKVYFGLIDNSFTNELQAVIQNISNHSQILPAGIAIVQLLVIPAPIPKFTLCLADTLPNATTRGSFGSTGQHFKHV